MRHGPPKLINREIVALDLKPSDGAVPPHDLDAEAAVLSACMLAVPSAAGLGSSTAYSEISHELKAVMFFSEAHLRIFEAIEQLAAEGHPVDPVTVGVRLKDRQRLHQVGGMPYIHGILDAAPVIRNVGAYARKIRETYQLRQFMLRCSRAAIGGYADVGSIPSYIAQETAELARLSEAALTDRFIAMRPLLKEAYADIKAAHGEGRPAGIDSGLRAYNRLTSGGLHRTEVTIIAARPGVGKTAALLALSINVAGTPPMIVADDGAPWRRQGVLFCSLEMSRKQIADRMIAIESGVSATRIRTGNLEDPHWPPVTQACHRLADFPIFVDDTPALTLAALRAKIQRARGEFARLDVSDTEMGPRLSVVCVDYLQLMKHPDARTRIEEIGEISRGLKGLAKTENVAIIVGCQLNRAVESRSGTKRPVISDLRESGDIEQDADNVIGLYRGAYYGEADPEGEEGRSEWIFLKQRNGPTDTIILQFTPETMRFGNMLGQH